MPPSVQYGMPCENNECFLAVFPPEIPVMFCFAYHQFLALFGLEVTVVPA